MDKRETPAKEKIVLPQNLQREMIKFFLQASMSKKSTDKEQQQTPPNSTKNGSGEHD